MTTAAEAARISTDNGVQEAPVTPAGVGDLNEWDGIVSALKAKHGQVWKWESEALGVTVIFRAPASAAQVRYRDTIANRQLGEAERQYCIDCVVWPPDFKSIIDKLPAIANPLSTCIEERAGADRQAKVSKL